MPSEYIRGKDVMLYVYVAGIWTPVACYTNVTLSLTHEMLKTTSKDSGNWNYYIKGISDWQATAEGVQFLDAVLTFDTVRQWGIDGTPLLILFSSTGIKGTQVASWRGYCLVASESTSGAVNEPAPYSLNLQGNGALEADFASDTSDMLMEQWYYYTATGNEGNEIVIPDLIGYIPNFRAFRAGTVLEPSGILSQGRDATAAPGLTEYQWDSSIGKMIFNPNNANLAPDEKVNIPFVPLFTGCTLSIDGLMVATNGATHFVLNWNGTGIPNNQLLFEHSNDYGNTWVTATGFVSSSLDSFTSDENLDTTQSWIWRLTPVCGNGAKGTADVAYWNTTIIRIDNKRTDTKISFVSYTKDNGQNVFLGALNNNGSQKTLITYNASPLSTAGTTVNITLQPGAQGAYAVIMDATGNTLGSGAANTSPYGQISVYIPAGLPNEFKIILS